MPQICVVHVLIIKEFIIYWRNIAKSKIKIEVNKFLKELLNQLQEMSRNASCGQKLKIFVTDHKRIFKVSLCSGKY